MNRQTDRWIDREKERQKDEAVNQRLKGAQTVLTHGHRPISQGRLRVTSCLCACPYLRPQLKATERGTLHGIVPNITDEAGKEGWINKQRERGDGGAAEGAGALTVSDVWFTLQKRLGEEITSQAIINMICSPQCHFSSCPLPPANRNVKMSRQGSLF